MEVHFMPQSTFSPLIEVNDDKIDYGIFNGKTMFEEDAKLFPKDRPDPNDIKQGKTDLDCYFLSVVAGVAKSKPNKLWECFPEYNELRQKGKKDEINRKFSEDDTVVIKFYKVKKFGEKYICDGEVYFRVDKTALRKGGAPWVRLLEKAYVFYRSKKYDVTCSVDVGNKKNPKIKSRIIDGLNGGNSASVMVTLTGEPSKMVDLPEDKDRAKVKKFNTVKKDGKDVAAEYEEEVLEIFNKIKENLEKGNIVTAGASQGLSIYSKGLFLKHCYTVIGTKEDDEEGCGFKYVTVRNPYANRSRIYEKDSKGVRHSKVTVHENENQKGVSELELNDFYKYFRCVGFDTEEPKKEAPSSSSSSSSSTSLESPSSTSDLLESPSPKVFSSEGSSSENSSLKSVSLKESSLNSSLSKGSSPKSSSLRGSSLNGPLPKESRK